ncbi:hypothetical protein I3842_05G038100 [Carya illinoinensis]|uniref:Secreted protein n=1 Tax=Carya illinoinensis TaxID=32201 RepID=A0A922JNM5_CARIL|nr:hypothetical protein I3842_05G038100 [Carya illinoinensis]
MTITRTRSLISAACLLLGFLLRQNAFVEMFGVAMQANRMNYSPPCSRLDLVLGLKAHIQKLKYLEQTE